MDNTQIKATTIVAIRHKGELALGSDGQATMGHTVVKSSVNKVRKLADGAVLVGFAGAAADAFTLLERLEKKLSEHINNLSRASLELAKEWRTDRYLRKLEASLIVCDDKETFNISGNGDVMKPDSEVVAIGSGGMYAYAAALTLKKHAPHLTAKQMVEEALHLAGDICIYTNHNLTIETLSPAKKQP